MLRARNLGLLALAAGVLAGAAWWALSERAPEGAGDEGLLLPGFEDRIEAVDRIEVVGAGGKTLVAVVRVDGSWRMPDRLDWPGNQREISRALFRLAGARKLEAKTANPGLYDRLGVEDVTGEDATGVELRLEGGGDPVRLVIGRNHPGLGGSYVRLADQARSWLVDEDLSPARRPADWLDRRLVDLPMALVAEVEVKPAEGQAFRLVRDRDGRFVLPAAPRTATVRMDEASATAGVPDQLVLDDVAADDGSEPGQTLTWFADDGVQLSIALWQPEGQQTWARLSARLDEDKALAWYERAVRAEVKARAAESGGGEGGAGTGAEEAADEAGVVEETEAAADDTDTDVARAAAERVAARRAEIEAWQARFAGKRFLIPPYKAANLLKGRADYLEARR
ncbi:DUF4340 domain-containing protein [Arenimonas fontis]|uniref:DUF4340 domain-containing protein n=1 Tax=Arenimonas fontis TaxID=2608255 RepID=A0A5B2ZFA5_9GAMM|nr:DUF4340 domain-containing protein [Arenimonas fontis]KAA2286223.1 DUF4340 domain-containing protein [Arenimonas fontis]